MFRYPAEHLLRSFNNSPVVVFPEISSFQHPPCVVRKSQTLLYENRPVQPDRGGLGKTEFKQFRLYHCLYNRHGNGLGFHLGDFFVKKSAYVHGLICIDRVFLDQKIRKPVVVQSVCSEIEGFLFCNQDLPFLTHGHPPVRYASKVPKVT